MKYLTVTILFIILFINSSYQITISELKTQFQYKLCIPGSLPTISTETNKEQTPGSKIVQYLDNFDSSKTDVSVLSNVNELCQYHDISCYYELIAEEGPPHNKQFTIKLSLGDETFNGVGSSLKKAQQSAASTALEESQYERLPEKQVVPKTPTVVLNNIAAKLGISVRYYFGDQDITNSIEVDERSKKSYLQKLNDSIYDSNDKELHIPIEDRQVAGPFQVRVEVDNEIVTGFGHTIQAARHDAAIKAIKQMKDNIIVQNSPCLEEGREQECKQAKDKLKSPISLIYETAQQRNLDEPQFEIIDESGSDHKKQFTTECRIGHLRVQGIGKSKKESKRIAAENALKHLDELPPVTDESQILNALVNSSNDKQKRKNKKKNKIIKTNVEKVGKVVGDLYDSIISFGSEEKKKPSPPQAKKPINKSAQDEVLDLTNAMQIEMRFSDFEEEDRVYSVLSLDIKPPHMCLGEGFTKTGSRNKAADEAIKFLHKKGFTYSFKTLPNESDDESISIDDPANLYLVQNSDK